MSQEIIYFSGLLRSAFILFEVLIYWHLIFWRAKLEPEINKSITFYFLVGLFISFVINGLILFRWQIGSFFYLILSAFILVKSIFLFYAYLKEFEEKRFYLLATLPLFILFFTPYQNYAVVLGLFIIGASYIHTYFEEVFSYKKPVDKMPEILKKGGILPFVVFGIHFVFLGFYFTFDNIYFNILATASVVLAVLLRTKTTYGERFNSLIFYSTGFTVVILVIFYAGLKFISDSIEMEKYHKKLMHEKLAIAINDRIDAYSNLIKIITASDELREKMAQGRESFNEYLSYINQALNCSVTFFIDKNGYITASSSSYRKELLGNYVGFRKYFKESMNGKLSVFIARGVYTKREDARVSYPVYMGNNVAGVLVLQFEIDDKLKNIMKAENSFLMHKSGAVLIGPEEIKNKFIYAPSSEEIEYLYREKIFGSDRLYFSNFKRLSEEVFEDSKNIKWHLVKEPLTDDWFIASFINLSVYDKYKAVFLLWLLFIGFISHYFAVREFEKIRSLFLKTTESFLLRDLTLENIEVAVVHIDAAGKISYLNKEASELLGISKEEAIDKKIDELFIIKEHENPSYKVLKTSKQEIPVFYSYAEVLIKDKKPGAVITLKDATEEIRKQKLQKRIETLEIVSKISAGVVHDFNNYLMVFTGNLSILEKNLKEQNNRQLIRRMLDATKSISAIIDEMKALTIDYVGKKEKINVNEIAETVASFVLNGSNISYKISAKELLFVCAQQSQLYRVFQNLIYNAKQALNDSGEITIEILRYENRGDVSDLPQGRYVLIKITDNGPGIPEEYIDRLFDPFFTLRKEGKGLGLTIVRNIVQKLGGNITVQSKIGEGTTFYIYLPEADS